MRYKEMVGRWGKGLQSVALAFRHRWLWKIFLVGGLASTAWHSGDLLEKHISLMGLFPIEEVEEAEVEKWHQPKKMVVKKGHRRQGELGQFRRDIAKIEEMEMLLKIKRLVQKRLWKLKKSGKKTGRIGVMEERDVFHPPENAYHFLAVTDSFKRVDLSKISLLGQNEFHNILLQGMPAIIAQRSKEFLFDLLKEAQKRQVDPFWAVAVTWVESAFNPEAKSYVNATGLMQVMPATGQFLINRLDGPISMERAKKAIRDPQKNMELGVYYLDSLLSQFKGNYILATCSYNMGPAMVRRRLRVGRPVGKKNLYLDKVTAAYIALIRPFKKAVKKLKHPYRYSYIARKRAMQQKLEEKYSLFPFGLPVDIATNGENRPKSSTLFL